MLKTDNLSNLRKIENFISNFNHTPTGFGLMIVSGGHMTCPPGCFTERSGRPDYQLIHTIDGSAVFKTKEVEFLMLPGTWTLINCSKYHYFSNDTTNWVYEYVHICGNDMNNYLACLPSLPFTMTLKEEEAISNYFNILTSRHRECKPKDFAMDNAIIAMLLSMLANATPSDQVSQIDSDLSRVIQYIHANYARKLTITELMEVAHLSKYYFCHVFKTETGMSPYQYTNWYRLQKAEELLVHDYLSIHDIALRCGFSSTGAFIRAYKAQNNRTPGKSRNNKEE